MTLPAPAASGRLTILAQFSYLQLVDVLTTLAFLSNGVREANPLIRFVMVWSGSPFATLLAIKAAAMIAALACVSAGRTRVVARMNLFFAALIVWNLVALAGH